jgi:hypothetical protein
VRGVIGLDGGSTSSKAVLVDEEGEIVCKAYQLSKGNPIQDTKELLTQLRSYVADQGATLEVLGFGATGYAADVLQECVRADVNIVETVAHMMSAVKFFGDVDVICDIGGQDIKVLFMKNGDIANFRLSNSCSAGNGMLLQAMADQFGLKVTEYADTAFQAELAPKFSYGCAVFLDTDRVNFQKEGFSKEELLAGLAQVLPKNVWQYVVQIPRLASLGTRYVLQGGTQYNLAAVKAQVDYIKERVPGAEVFVHPHTGEAGALGAAFETLRVVKRRGKSTFIGIDAAIDLEYTTKNDDETVCHFCPNECKRTFIDTQRPDGSTSRYISGFSCEKGTVESEEAMLASWPSGRRSPSSSRTSSTTSRSGVPPLLRGRPDARRGHAREGRDVKKGFFGIKKVETTRPFRAAARRAGEAPRTASASRGCSTCTRRRRTSARTSRRSASRSRTSSSAIRDHRGDVGRGRQIRLGRPVLPVEGRRRRTSTTCCSTTTPTEKPLSTSSSPSSRTCRASARGDGQDELPHRGRRARRDEGRVHEGGRLLRAARHRVPRPALTFAR